MAYEMGLRLEKTSTTVSALEEISEPENQREIAALAYEFWQARGCPDGTPDKDWFRAKREIAGSKKIDEQGVESPDTAERSIAEKFDLSVVRFPVRSELSQAAHAGASRRA
jgi:hypothetical protein